MSSKKTYSAFEISRLYWQGLTKKQLVQLYKKSCDKVTAVEALAFVERSIVSSLRDCNG